MLFQRRAEDAVLRSFQCGGKSAGDKSAKGRPQGVYQCDQDGFSGGAFLSEDRLLGKRTAVEIQQFFFGGKRDL